MPRLSLLVPIALVSLVAAFLPATASAKAAGVAHRGRQVEHVHPAPRPALTEAHAVSPSRSHHLPGTGNLLFKAAHINEFWLNQSAPGAVTEVANPTDADESVFQMTVKNSDVYPLTPTDNPRAELVSEPIFHEGSEFWASAKFFLPGNFPSSVPGWLGLLEGPYGEPFEGTPPWHIEVNGESIRWQRNGTYDWDIPWEMPLEHETWVNVLLHERYAHDGWIEMWIDGKQVNFFADSEWNPHHEPDTYRLSMETMDASNDEGPGSIHEMNYRQAGMFATTTVLEGPLAIGTSRESVEP